jgi:hypothetical protein
MAKAIYCDCGCVVRGGNDQALLAAVRRHIAKAHRDLAGKLSDEQVLGMAVSIESAA